MHVKLSSLTTFASLATRAAALVLFAAPLAFAETITCTGVLGNSGEQGATLVRQLDKPAPGFGVTYDRFGTLWDRGGSSHINRYSPDGRLLATYPFPTQGKKGSRGGNTAVGTSTVLIGDTLMIKYEGRLYTLPVTAPAGTEPSPMEVEASLLSPSSHNGWAVAALDGEIFLVNTAGEKKPVTTVKTRLFDVEITETGAIYARYMDEAPSTTHRVHRIDAAAPADARGPWPRLGNRMQWFPGRDGQEGKWFAHEGHGTIRRFNADFKPDPGVVLGGASGSFIGYVPGDHELDSGIGMARLGENLFAVSGRTGMVFLLEWQPDNRRMEIVRRIGAIPDCSAVAINREGKVYCNGGYWLWTDGPDVPLNHSRPIQDDLIGAATTPDDTTILIHAGKKEGSVHLTKMNGPADRNKAPVIPKDAVAGTVAPAGKRHMVFAVNATGRGVAFGVTGRGEMQGKPSDVELQTVPGAAPLTKLSTLTALPDGRLLGTDNGAIIEFALPAGALDAKGTGPAEGAALIYTEARRWSTWTADAGGDASFGASLRTAFSKGRLWVSDTEKNRVLCFALSDKGEPTLVATFGTGKPGDDLASATRPEAIAAFGDRAVVHDSGNQRLLKLEIR
ncbi:hypothetical protein DB346_12640 [Verrucomicrobia bacterium LW23]|nr:hypothetical protein DB346_12640 [Verrucomicrobia bacterium LW23]